MLINNNPREKRSHHYFVIGFIKVWEALGSTFIGQIVPQKLSTVAFIEQKLSTKAA